MDDKFITGEFINELERILISNIPDIGSDVLSNIKLDCNEVLDKILIKHKIFGDLETGEEKTDDDDPLVYY